MTITDGLIKTDMVFDDHTPDSVEEVILNSEGKLQGKRKNRFKHITTLIDSLATKRERSFSVKEREKYESTIQVLLTIRQWIITNTSLDERRHIRIKTYLENNCNISETASKLDMTNVALRKFISRENTVVCSYVTDEIMNLLEEGNYKEGLFYFNQRIGANKEKGILPTGIKALMPVGKLDLDIIISECKYELQILKLYARATIEKNVSKCDIGNLRHLLGLLESTKLGTQYEKDLLEGYLTETLLNEEGRPYTFDEFIVFLKEKDL